MQAFIVSIVAGIFFPIVPMLAEQLFLNHIKPETLTTTAVAYAAAIGLTSRHQAILISCRARGSCRSARIWSSPTTLDRTRAVLLVAAPGAKNHRVRGDR